MPVPWLCPACACCDGHYHEGSSTNWWTRHHTNCFYRTQMLQFTTSFLNFFLILHVLWSLPNTAKCTWTQFMSQRVCLFGFFRCLPQQHGLDHCWLFLVSKCIWYTCFCACSRGEILCCFAVLITCTICQGRQACSQKSPAPSPVAILLLKPQCSPQSELKK